MSRRTTPQHKNDGRAFPNKNRRIVLAPRYNLRVEDFQDCHALVVECMNCGHKGRVSASKMREMFEPYERIKLIEGKLRCGKCGKVNGTHWHVEESATGP